MLAASCVACAKITNQLESSRAEHILGTPHSHQYTDGQKSGRPSPNARRPKHDLEIGPTTTAITGTHATNRPTAKNQPTVKNRRSWPMRRPSRRLRPRAELAGRRASQSRGLSMARRGRVSEFGNPPLVAAAGVIERLPDC